MNRMRITSFPSIAISIALALSLASCGGEEDAPPVEETFRLSDVRAENLRLVGMAKELGGDTAGMDRADEPVPSPEKSKVAYCRNNGVYVADADGKTAKLLYDATQEADIRSCYNLRWSPTGEELTFTQAKGIPGDTLQLVTVVITLGKSSENE